MTPRDRALRSQDIQSGLQGLADVPAVVTSELDTTLLTGMAARLATHIRGADVFGDEHDIKRLKLVASNLGIESLHLPQVLNFLQEAEFVRTRTGTGGKLVQVTETIPVFGDLYERLGQVHVASGMTEVEDALTQSFHTVVAGPRLVRGDLPLESLSPSLQPVVFSVLDQASLVRSITSPSGKLLYSPQYWEEHGDSLAAAVATYGDERIRQTILRVTNKPGLPIGEPVPGDEEGEILNYLCDFGMLPAPVVTSWKGAKSFAFTPLKGITADPQLEVRLLDKTRAILASVRYGEAFGTITSIADPAKLLKKLRSTGRIGPHSEIYDQYKVLVDVGVGRISRDTTFSSRFHLHFIPTDENKAAIDAAIIMLQGGSNVSAAFEDADLHKFAINGEYTTPMTSRAQRRFQVVAPDAVRGLRASLLDIVLSD